MPDNSLQIVPPPAPSSLSVPDTGMPKLDSLDTAQHRMDIANLGETSDDYARSLGDNRQTITDLINDVTALQAEGAGLLKNYGGVPNAPSPGGFNPEKGYQELSEKLNPSKKTLQATNTPMVLGTVEDFNRYKDSKYFQTFGYTPNLGEEQEFKYGRAMTWGDTVANAWGGGKTLAANTFIEGWKGWGRMTEALLSWDASKLMGSQEERYKMAQEQNEIMSKYAIYDNETSKDSIWNRQFFGNMLQQSGFAVGAGLQFAVEEFLTMGLGTAFEAVAGGLMLAKTAKTLEKASELANATRKVMNTVTKQAKVENAILNGVKTLLPGYKSAQELARLHKAGAGFAQFAYTGLGGIRRGLSEFNMARSESIFEAASTYKQLEDRLVNEYIREHGVPPQGDELERIRQSAEDASHDNFVTNVGILSVMNRFQFDTMTKQFSKTRRLVNVGEAELADAAFEVSGKIAGQTQKRVYEKGFLGRFNAVGDIAKDFGKRKAAWEATKSIGRGLGKFEGLEGMQELLQTASDVGLEEYYYDLYHGKKGYGDRMDAVLANIQNPITNMEGMKTFLMGALTGRLIAPMSSAIGGISTKIGDARKLKENPNYKNEKQKTKEAVSLLNELYKDPSWFKKEALASIKINNKAAETMEEAAKNSNRYVFNNHKDSAFAKGVASAIKLNMYDSLRDSIKEMGNEMDEKQFKEAFGIDLTEGNKRNVRQLTDEMVAQVDDYYNTFNTLKDKYGDLVIPELYKNNKGDAYNNARLARAALDDAIELIATNSYKAKQAIKRASVLQSEIAANKNIGASSLQVLTTMGSEQALSEHIKTLEKEISTLKTPGAILTKEQKEILKDKEEELHLAKTWQSSYDEIMGNDSAEYSPTTEGRAYNSFSKLINLFNKKSKNYTTVSKEDVDDNFIKLTDYIKLNRDNRDYVDAMNLLADPFNMKLVANSINSAMQGIQRRYYEEHKEELEAETGIITAEPPKHTIVKEEDGTWTIKSPDGSDAKTGFATEEEAKTEKEKMDAVLAEEFAKEQQKTKAAAAAKTSQVITDPASVKKGDFIISDSGTLYEIRDILPDGKVQYLSVKDGGKGVWGKDQFEQYIKEGRFTREVTPETPTSTTIDPFDNIESFETSKGSVYTILPDGRTQRFKKVTGVTSEPSDLIVFVKFISEDQEQDFLRGVQDDTSGTKVYVIDKDGKRYSKNSDIRGKEVKFALVDSKTDEVLQTVETKQEPTIGYSTYDERRFTENGEQYRSKHIGNEVTKINYKAKPTGVTVKDLIDEINAIELTSEAFVAIETKILDGDLMKDFSEDDKDAINDALNKKDVEVKEAEKAAKAAGTKKFLLDTDPEFLNLYIPATKKIASIVSANPTEQQVTLAFRELGNILIKLDPSVKYDYINKHMAEKEDIINKIRANAKANDIQAVKNEITKALSDDDVSLDTTVESLFDTLNIDLNPELKQEAIEHFEVEYLKAIERKITKLNSLINTTGATPVLTHLLKTTNAFKKNVEESIKIFKEKSEELNTIRNGHNFAIEEDYSYTNKVHRSIQKGKDTDSSEAQYQAIEDFLKSGLLVEQDFQKYDRRSRQKASFLINMAIGRSYTLQLNKVIRDYFKTGNSTEFRTLLTKYLTDKNDTSEGKGLTTEQIDKLVDEYIKAKSEYNDDEVNEYINENFSDQDAFPNIENVINDAQYKALTQYRFIIYKLMADVNVIDVINHVERRQSENISRGENFDIKKCFTLDDAKAFDKNLENNKDLTPFYTAFIATYEEVRKATTPVEAGKLISELGDKYLSKDFKTKQPKKDAVSLLDKIFASLLQTESILDNDNDGSNPLTEEQMETILDKPDQSLTRSQISQIETFAKTEKLDKIKTKFGAAVGHSPEVITYTPAGTAIQIDKITFSSLRQKYADDTRTSEDLAVKLMADADGNISAKKALDFIVRSKYSTTAEKQLAQKLLAAAQDEDVIKIDNNLTRPGEYDSETNQIFINLDLLGYKQNKASAPIETVILHEMMHSVIEKAIADPNSEYAKGIKELYNLTKSKEGAKTFYAYQEGMSEDEKLREFVTEAFTNPAFQYLLASTPVSKTNKESVWDRLMTFLSKILKKFGVDMDSTVLSEVMSLTNNLFDKNDILPSERIMEQVKTASTEEELNGILDSLNKDDYNIDMYNSLVSAIKSKIDSVNAVRLKELTDKMKSIKINKTTYYYTNDNNNLEVYKKVKYKLSRVKKAEILNAIKEEIAKTNPPPPGPTNTTTPYTIESDLKNAKYNPQLTILDFNQVSAALSKTAAEKNAFRSTSFDGAVSEDGEFIEQENFVNYYYKIRNIINKLSVLSPDQINKLGRLYVTITKDDAGLRWDGSAQDASWQKATKGVIGYISDENGNPVVFDKNGNGVGRADKNDPSSSRFNTGDNQIVYFNIVKKDTGGNPEEHARMNAVREAVEKGETHIAPLQKFSQGQMTLKGVINPISVNQKNTARDMDIQEMMNQDHVTLDLNGPFLNAVIKDESGAVNRTALFPPRSGAVKLKTPNGGVYTMIDHVIELMKVYQQLKAEGNPDIEKIREKVVYFIRHLWLTGKDTKGNDRNLKVFSTLSTMQIKKRNPKDKTSTPSILSIFQNVDGVLTVNEENVKKIKSFVDNMKINIDKGWLESGTFDFPYITEEDGKKMINFEEKNYRDFLVKEVGLITYINDIPLQKNIKRYNSIVHFLDPVPLNSKPSGVTVTQKDIVNNSEAIDEAVEQAIENVTPTPGKVVPSTKGGRRYSAVAFQTEKNKNYEKICK